MFRRILVPLDGSKLAEGVLSHVVLLAKSCGSKITLFQVVPPATQIVGFAGTSDLGPIGATTTEAVTRTIEAETQKAKEYVSHMADSLHARGIDADWEVRQGVVGPTITQFAKQASYDLVALSTHGRSGIGRLIFGSVADHVLRKSGLPILLVKPDMKGEGE